MSIHEIPVILESDLRKDAPGLKPGHHARMFIAGTTNVAEAVAMAPRSDFRVKGGMVYLWVESHARQVSPTACKVTATYAPIGRPFTCACGAYNQPNAVYCGMCGGVIAPRTWADSARDTIASLQAGMPVRMVHVAP